MPDLIRQSGKPTQPTQPTQQTSASSQQAAPKVQTLRTIPTEPRYNRTGPSEQKLIEVSDRIGGILRKQDTYDPQNPNIRSAAKRIHLYSAENPEQEANMLAQLAVSASQDQQSPFYKRYSLSTNNDIIQGLSSLGFDMTGGVTPEWLEQNKWLQDYYEYSNDYSQTPKAPTKKSTPLQQAAYLYYQLLKDEENTQNAENEWAQMQKDIAYFADLGYDDDEIIKQIRDRMTLGDYATLAKMQDYASNGLGRPMGLNRAIPYDEDSIYGAIWAARNGGGTGNALIDTIYAGAGIGNGWKYDPTAKNARDPSSANYNPYLLPTFRMPEGYDPDNDDGSWKSDLLTDGGVPKKPNSTFTPAQIRAYEIYQAQEVIENTHKAQEELAQLQEWARKQLENGLSADEIIERLGRDDYNSSSKTVFEATYPTLAKMELYRSRGGYMELSAPVDYTPNSFRAWLENTAGSGSENTEEPAEQTQGGSAPTQEQGGGQSLGEAVIGGALSVINGTTKFFNDTLPNALVDAAGTGIEFVRTIPKMLKAVGATLSSPETLGEGDADEHLTGDWTNQSAPEESNGQMTDEQMASFMSEWGAMYTPTSKLPTASGFLASAAPSLMTDTGDSAISQIIADGQEEINAEVSLAEEIVAFRRGELSVDDASDLFKNWYNTVGSTLLGGFTFTNGTYDEGGEYHAGGVDNPLWELGPTAQKALDILGHSELTAQQEAEMVITLSRHYAAANTLGVDLEEFYNQNGTARAEIERYRDDAYQNVRGNVQRYLEGEAAGEIDTNLYMRIMTEANNVDISQQKIDDYYYKQIHNRLASYASEEVSRINGEDFDAWIEGGGVDTEESIENERRMLRITGAKYDADKQLDFDLRLATMCGMTLSDFYKAYPQYRTFDPDNIDVGVSAMLDKGVQRYKQFEDSVAELRQMDYATLEQEYNELYRLYTDPEAFNELVSESIPQENTVAAQNLTPQELAQLAQNGQGLKRDLSFLFDIIPFTVEHGFQSFLLSNLKAIDYWAVDRTDQQLETAARSLYTRSEYNRLVYETIDQIEDPEEQQYWRERADNATDIYELDFNYLQQHIKTLIEDKEQFNAEVEQYIEENGTAFEKEFFEDGSMLVSNGLTMAETAVLDAATGGMARFATTLATYGFTAGAEMGRRVEETTGNRTLGKMAGVVAAVWQAWSEKHDPLNFLGDAEAYTESFFRYGIMRGVRNGTAGKTTSYLSRLGLELLHDPVVVTKLLGKHMLQEGGQELYQALGDEAIRSFFTGTQFHYEIGDAWQEFKGGAILGGVFAAIEAMPESWHGHRDAMRIVESGDYSPRAVGELLNLYGEIYNMRTSELERTYGPQVNVRAGARFEGDTATITDTGRYFHQNAVAAQVMRDIADGAMHEVARGDLYNKYNAAERAYNAAYSKRSQMEQLLQDKTEAYNQACTEYLGDGVDTLANPDLANEVAESFKAMQEAQSGLDASLPAVEETFAVYKDAMTAYKAAMDEAFNNVRAAAEATVTKTEMGQYARLQQIRENFNKRTEAAIDQVIGELNIPPEQQADMRKWLGQNFDPFTGRARLNPETLRAEANSMMRSNVLANTRAIIEGTAPVTTETAPAQTGETAPVQTAETAQAENDLVDAEIELTQAQEAYDAAIGTDGEEAAAQRLQNAQGQVESAHKRMMDLRDMVAADRAAGGTQTQQVTPAQREQRQGYRRSLMEVRDLIEQDRLAGYPSDGVEVDENDIYGEGGLFPGEDTSVPRTERREGPQTRRAREAYEAAEEKRKAAQAAREEALTPEGNQRIRNERGIEERPYGEFERSQSLADAEANRQYGEMLDTADADFERASSELENANMRLEAAQQAQQDAVAALEDARASGTATPEEIAALVRKRDNATRALRRARNAQERAQGNYNEAESFRREAYDEYHGALHGTAGNDLINQLQGEEDAATTEAGRLRAELEDLLQKEGTRGVNEWLRQARADLRQAYRERDAAITAFENDTTGEAEFDLEPYDERIRQAQQEIAEAEEFRRQSREEAQARNESYSYLSTEREGIQNEPSAEENELTAPPFETPRQKEIRQRLEGLDSLMTEDGTTTEEIVYELENLYDLLHAETWSAMSPQYRQAEQVIEGLLETVQQDTTTDAETVAETETETAAEAETVQEETEQTEQTEEQPALTPEQQEANTKRIQDVLANDAAADAVAQSPEVQQAFNALQDARAKLEQIRAGEAPLHGTEMGRTLLENLKAAQAEVTQAETNLANSILTAAEGIDLTAPPVVENTVQAPAAETVEATAPAAEGTAPAAGIPVQTETQEGTAPTEQANAPTVSQTATAPKGARKRGVTITNGDESAYMNARAYREMARRWVRVAAADRANAAVANGSAPAATAPSTQHRRLGTGGMYNTQEENAYLASRDTREAAAATGLNVDTLPGRMGPIATENGKAERSIRNPWMIARRLASRIGYSANMSSETLHAGGTKGVTNNRVGYVAVSAPNAQNMAVLFHEMGHAVGARIGMSGNSHLVDLMDPNFRQMYIDTHQDVQAESFAEFFATYMTDPNKGAGIVGEEFVAQFEQQCKDAGHGIWKAVTEAREDTQTFVTASLQEQTLANINYDENIDVRTLGQKWLDLIHRFTAGFVDRAESTVRMDNIVRAQTGAEINLANGNSVEGYARRIDFAADIAGNIMTGQMTAPDGRVIGDGFSTTIAEHGVNADNYKDWHEYMILLYSLDRAAAGKDFLQGDIEEREMLIEVLEQRYNGQNGMADFAAARDAFYKAWDTFMQAWMVNNSRRISPQLYNQFVEMYPHFFPIMFVADYDQMAKRTGEAHAKHYAPKYAREGKNPIVDPLQALNNIVGRIVEQGLRDRAMQQFDANYSAAEGFGMFARKMRDTREGQVLLGGANRMSVLENAQRAARDAATAVVESIKNKKPLINEMGLPPEAISRDIEEHTNEYFRDRNSLESMQQVLSFADQLERAFDAGADEAGMVTVYRPDGTSAQYEIYDKSFLNFALGTKGTSQILKVLRPVTRFMSTWTTGRNPLFAAKNAMRDFQMSVNRGTWASNYATGAIKWGRAFLDVMISDIGKRTGIEALENFGKFAEYSRMGGGNAEAYDSESRRGLRALRRDFYEGYNTSTAGRALAEGGRLLGRVLTFEHLNGWIESASRYAEYRFGKVGRESGIKGLLGAQRQLTVAEQEQAFQNAQEVTVNFRRGGNSQALAELKAIIPFFGASIQGAANTMRMFTSKTIPTGRKAAMITKTIVNTVISTALSAMMCKKWLDDDEQEALYYINDTYKTEYYLLPNLFKGIFGDSSLIRIPKGQDPLLYGISGAVWDLFWGPNGRKDDGERGWMIDLEEMGNAILDVMLPVDVSNYKRLLGSTVAGPITDIIFNENYYGSEIVPSYMQEMYGENNPSQMYYNTTPETMVAIGKLLNVSPLKVQYIAKQYTGFLGQVGLPALRAASGGLGGIFDSVIATTRNSLTADQFQSNNILNKYYSGRDFVQEVVDTAKSAMRTEEGYALGQLRNMGSRDGQMAIEDANELVHGPIAEAKQAIKEFKEAQNRIGGMQGLTDRERAKMIEYERARMLDVVLNANEAIGAYMDKYTYRNDAARVFDLIFGDEEPYNPAQDR